MSDASEGASTVLGVVGQVGQAVPPPFGTIISGAAGIGGMVADMFTAQDQAKDAEEAEEKRKAEEKRIGDLQYDKQQRSIAANTKMGGNDTIRGMYGFGNNHIAPLNESPERIGNETEPMSSTSEMVVGPRHEDGGVDVPGSEAEVEGGEVLDNGMVFSDRLPTPRGMSFAVVAKTIAEQKGANEEEMTNTIDRYKVYSLERDNEVLDVALGKLFKLQGETKDQMEKEGLI